MKDTSAKLPKLFRFPSIPRRRFQAAPAYPPFRAPHPTRDVVFYPYSSAALLGRLFLAACVSSPFENTTAIMLVLFETPAGFALFKANDKKLQKVDNLWEEFQTPEKAAEV